MTLMSKITPPQLVSVIYLEFQETLYSNFDLQFAVGSFLITKQIVRFQSEGTRYFTVVVKGAH